MRVIIVFLILLSINCSGQSSVDKNCSSEGIKYDSTIKVFIKGIKETNELDAKFFQNEFELTAIEENIEIIFFRIIINSRRGIAVRPNEGKRVTPDYIENETKKDDYSLRFLTFGEFISFDNIVVKKGDTCFKASPILMKIK